MRGCWSLEHVDLRPLSGLTVITDRFLSECTSLIELDLTPLRYVTRIGYGMMRGSNNTLPAIDLSSMVALQAIPEGVVELGDNRLLLPQHLLNAIGA